jgi:hypothetical protein
MRPVLSVAEAEAKLRDAEYAHKLEPSWATALRLDFAQRDLMVAQDAERYGLKDKGDDAA